MRRRPALLAALALLLGAPVAQAGQPVHVLYAGSLVALMEHTIGPAFGRASGDTFEGFFGGSKQLANQIRGKLRRADVFVSSSPKADALLMGRANGDWVRWYAALARSPVVIGYDPHSHFAHDLQTKPWWQVLAEPGFRLGRTDPKLDPLGALILQIVDRAETKLHQSGLATRILKNAEILPDGAVLGRLQSGQLDAAFFYSTETAETHVPAIGLPPDIVLQAHYTVTIPRGADPDAAARFVAFLFGAEGRALMRQHGLDLVPPRITGDAAAVPASLRPVLTSAR